MFFFANAPNIFRVLFLARFSRTKHLFYTMKVVASYFKTIHLAVINEFIAVEPNVYFIRIVVVQLSRQMTLGKCGPDRDII